MARNDPLLVAVGKARLSGSAKTMYNHKVEAARFVSDLRANGYGVSKWSNITNKHIQAVVDYWREEKELATATIKEYLSGVRSVARAFGNEIISPHNATFGLGQRTYIATRDRSVPEAIYQNAIRQLNSGHDLKQRVALAMQLMRELGLRHEEARKFNPFRDYCDIRETVTIAEGTKGGRERTFEVSDAQKALIDQAKRSGFYTNKNSLIPSRWTERQFEQYVYREARKLGISREKCGASLHGLRHARAHEIYKEISGFNPSCRFKTRDEFIDQARAYAGDRWQDRDNRARAEVCRQFGHSPSRRDVSNTYLGSSWS